MLSANTSWIHRLVPTPRGAPHGAFRSCHRPERARPGRALWPGTGSWPQWLPRVGMADFCSIEVLMTVATSAGAEVSRGGARAILARMEGAGFFRESAVGGVFLLRPEVETMMLAELERGEHGIERVRQQLSAAGLAQPAGGIGPQLAKWALESGDWASFEAVWRMYSPGDLVADPGVRAGYAAVPTELRAKHPGLSFAAAVASAYEPESGRLDLDRMITSLIRDGRTLHGDWAHHRHRRGPCRRRDPLDACPCCHS